jgi:hypothetical protein
MKRFFDWVQENEVRFYAIMPTEAITGFCIGVTFLFMMAIVTIKVIDWFWKLIWF